MGISIFQVRTRSLAIGPAMFVAPTNISKKGKRRGWPKSEPINWGPWDSLSWWGSAKRGASKWKHGTTNSNCSENSKQNMDTVSQSILHTCMHSSYRLVVPIGLFAHEITFPVLCIAVVPQHYPGLGRWVKQQRREFKLMKEGKRTTMSPEKVLKLADIGFVFDAQFRRGSKISANNYTKVGGKLKGEQGWAESRVESMGSRVNLLNCTTGAGNVFAFTKCPVSDNPEPIGNGDYSPLCHACIW